MEGPYLVIWFLIIATTFSCRWAIYWSESGTTWAQTFTNILWKLFYGSGWTAAFVARSVWSNWRKRPEVCASGHQFRPFWPAEPSLSQPTAAASLFPFHKDEQTEDYRSAEAQENRCSPASTPHQMAGAECWTLLSPHTPGLSLYFLSYSVLETPKSHK